MATITPVVADRPAGAVLAGSTPTAITPAGGLTDSIVMSGSGLLLRFISTTGTPTITLQSEQFPSFPGGQQAADVDPVLTLGSGATRVVKIPSGDYPRFADPTTGLLDLVYSSAANWTFEAWQL